MPQTKEALQHILRITEQQFAMAEARLLQALSDEERQKTIELAADLKIKSGELRELLVGEHC